MACGPGRNAGDPTPSWWPAVRRVLKANLAHFPKGISLPFLGAWVEQESGGRHYIASRLGEMGYFQLHPETIIDHFGGRAAVAKIRREIIADPNASARWGGKMLSQYADELDQIGVPRGSELWHGLLKAMHWSPTARIWAQHVRYAVGYWPSTYEDFHDAMMNVQRFGLWKPRLRHPDRLISCSPLVVLGRTTAFIYDEDRANAHRGVAGFPWPWMLPGPMLMLDYTDPIPYTARPFGAAGESKWWLWALGGVLAVGSLTGFAYLAATARRR